MASQLCQILLVEPDQSDLDIIQSVLTECGLVVHCATSAKQAIDIFATQTIDIVLTELNIGGNADGLELMKRLALVDHSVKVIFLSDGHGLDIELKALTTGAFDYLRKPIAHARLLQHVAVRAYEFSKLERQNQNLLLELETTRNQLAASESTLLSVKKRFRQLAATDALTNLYNRRFVETVLKQEVDRCNRYKTALSIAFIDVDAFTPLCQAHGREISNYVLKDIARILMQCSRTSDIVGRFATDVFVVLLPETTPQNALIFAKRAQTLIQSTGQNTGQNTDQNTGKNTSIEKTAQPPSQVTVCIGISGIEVASDSVTVKQITFAASKALHSAKQRGPNNVCAHPATIQPPLNSSKSAHDDGEAKAA